MALATRSARAAATTRTSPASPVRADPAPSTSPRPRDRLRSRRRRAPTTDVQRRRPAGAGRGTSPPRTSSPRPAAGDVLPEPLDGGRALLPREVAHDAVPPGGTFGVQAVTVLQQRNH